MSKSDAKYFDLVTTGLGYVNRLRHVTLEKGEPFWSVSIAALRGSVDEAQYVHFECRVSGKQAQEVVLRLQPAAEGNAKVLIGFTLSDLQPEIFRRKGGERAGTTGVSIRARLLRIAWAKVDGKPFYSEDERYAA